MKIAALVQSYGEVEFLPAVLESLKTYHTLVMNSKFKQTSDCVDKTYERVRGFDNTEVIIDHTGDTQAGSYNAGLEYLKDYDRVLIVDSDEILLTPDRKILELLADKADCISAKIIDYSNASLTKRFELRGHHPVVMVNPKTVRFTNCRCVNGGCYKTDEVTVHHLGYVAQDLKWKLDWGNKVDRGAGDKVICSPQHDCVPPVELVELVFGR